MRVKVESLPQGTLPFSVTVFSSNAVADQASFVVSESSRDLADLYFIRSPWFEMKQWEAHQAGFGAWRPKVDRLRDSKATNAELALVSSSPSQTSATVEEAAQKGWSAITNSLPDGHLFPDRALKYNNLNLDAARSGLDKFFGGKSGKYSVEKETRIGEKVLHLLLASKPSMFGFEKKCQMLLSEEAEGVLSLRLKIQIYGDSPQGGNRIPIHQSYYHTDSPSYARQAQQRVYEEMQDLLKKSLGQSVP